MIRKILNNNYFAFFLVVPFTVWLLFSMFSPVFVSASSGTGSIPDSFTASGGDSSFYQSCLSELNNNESFKNIDNGIVVLGGDSSSLFLCIIEPVDIVEVSDLMPKYRSSGVIFGGNIFYSSSFSFSQLSSYNFVLEPYNPSSSGQYRLLYVNSFSDNFMPFPIDLVLVSENHFQSPSDYYLQNLWLYFKFYSVFNNVVPYVPDNNNFLSLGIDKVGFYNWLVETTKESNFTPYFSLNKLPQYISFYDSWGASPSKFLMFYNLDFGDSFGDHLSNTQIISLKNLTDQLYREYLNSLKYPPADFPARDRVNIRKDIDTNTTDNNTVLITDDSNDTVIVSILRDILRGVIALRNQIFVTGTDIITGLNNLDFTVNVANDGGSGFDASDIWGSGSITESENYLALTAAFMDKGVDVSAAENMQINYLDNATQQDSFTVSVVMPYQFVDGQFTEKTVTHTIDNSSKMYNTLILFRKLIAFAVVAYFAIRIRFELPHLIRGE